MSQSANSKFETPVVLFGYNRPEFIRSRLEEFLSIEANKLIVSIDFESRSQIKKFKELESQFKDLWKPSSSLEFIFQKQNLGLARHITETITHTLDKYESVIVIEDDISVSQETILSLKYALTRYGSSTEFACVGGYSPLSLPPYLKKLNFFRHSRYFVCWGWGTTRDVWRSYKLNLEGIDIESSLTNSTLWKSLSNKQRETWLGRFRKIQGSQLHTWDIQFQYMMFLHDKKSILPAGRILENLGFNDIRSAHTKNKRPRWMGKERYSRSKLVRVLDLPLINCLFQFLESATVIGDAEVKFRKRLHFLKN